MGYPFHIYKFKQTIYMSEEARKYIIELFKVVDTRNILVVMHTGRIRRLYCPFMVICNVDVPSLIKGNEYFVDEIKMTLEMKDVFIIKGKAYYVWYFSIKV